jgi:hypothetical protein
MLADPPPAFLAKLSSLHAGLATRGQLFRMNLPTHLEWQRVEVVTHCPLPAVLQAVVQGYAETTPEDMWENTFVLCMTECSVNTLIKATH